jgi:putative hemolysin
VAAGHAHVHEPEEIRMLVEESRAGGLLQREERRLLENTLRLRELTVGEVMLPRVRMVAASVDEPCHILLASLANSTYSRMPLYAGSIDNIVGIVHLRDLLCLSTCAEPQPVRNVMRQVPFVVESASVETVFLQLQEEQDHVAIVVDEFGGTAGMVTLEDLIEEIFGDLQDEFDQEPPAVQVWPDNRVVLRGDTTVEDANYWLDLDLPSGEADTIGGLVLSVLGAVPVVGQAIEVNGLSFRVESMEGHAVGALSVVVEPRQAQRIQELAL